MFDIGFLEIIVILVITLLVVGPERMPEVARQAGKYMAKLRGFIDSVKNEGQLRDTVRELQQAVDLKEEQDRFKDIQEDLYKGFEDVRDEINFDELQRPFANDNPEPEPSKQAIEQARKQIDSDENSSTADHSVDAVDQPVTADASDNDANKPTTTS